MSPSSCKPLHVISPLHKALRQLSLYLEEVSRPLGLGPTEGHLLAFTACYGPFTVGQLARVFGLKGSSLTAVLDRLEKRELIRRSANPADRRSYLVDVTEQGRDLGLQARQAVQDLDDRILERLEEDEREGFARVMEAVAEVTGVTVR